MFPAAEASPEDKRLDHTLLQIDKIRNTLQGVDDPFLRNVVTQLGVQSVNQKDGDGGMSPMVKRMLDMREAEIMMKSLSGSDDQPDPKFEAVKKEIGDKMDELTKSMVTIADSVKSIQSGKQTDLEKGVADLKVLINEIKTQNPNAPLDTKGVLARVSQDVKDAEELLNVAGKEVVSGTISKVEAQTMFDEQFKEKLAGMDEDAVKEWAVKRGLKVIGGRVSYEEAQEMVTKAKEAAVDEVLADKRSDQVTGIIGKAIDKVLDMVTPTVQEIMKGGLDERIEQTQPPTEPEVIDSAQTGEDTSSSEQSDTAPSS